MKHLATQLLAAARLLVARPIRVDKQRLRELAKELQLVIERETQGRHGPLDKRVLVRGAPYDIRTVDGQERTIRVRLQSMETTSHYYVTGGGAGSFVGSGQPVIVIYLNGSLDAEVIYKSAKGSDLIAQQLYPVLLHEVTHQADIFSPGVGDSMSPEEAEGNPDYYNNTSEVHAYLQEVVDEIEQYLPKYDRLVQLFGQTRTVEHLLSFSGTWKEISPYWTEANKRKVIKAVVQRINEWRADTL